VNFLLIGHAGYLGRGLHAYLRRSHKVVGWDRDEDLFKLDRAVLEREEIDCIINLSVMADRGSPRFLAGTPTDQVNVQGARFLAEILSGTHIGWIQMSTREVYGPVYTPEDVVETDMGLRPKKLVGETQPYAPVNFYGKSKIVAEFLSESHERSAVIRLTTCYTDYDHPAGNWVVALIRNAMKGEPVTLTNAGRQFRDPLHVNDLGSMMEAIATKEAWGESFNAGGGDQNLISLEEFVRVAAPDVEVVAAGGGDLGFAFDIAKAQSILEWNPRVLVRERIPVIAENIRRGITDPPAG